MTTFLRRLADVEASESLSNRLRRRRFARFQSLLAELEHPVRILDVGGTETFWQNMRVETSDSISVVLLNLDVTAPTSSTFSVARGDATDLSRYADGAFDVVFSNSVIEHVGDLHAQRRMADEVRRVATHYWVQTPCRWFPIEPHFLFPLFGVMPISLRAWFIRHFSLGWRERVPDRDASYRAARSVRLLSRRELQSMFPDAACLRERFFGLTKSWILIGGWPH